MSINKILIVDDTQVELVNLKNIVAEAGVIVLTANSGKEALEIVRAEKPDLVFMDIVMDDVDGFKACRELNRDPETNNIPVVFVTTKSQRADKIWAEKQGARALITKPYTKEQILQQINVFR